MAITVDELIREIALRIRAVSAQDVQRIREHIASAPFSAHEQRVPVRYRGLSYQGRTVQARDDSAFVHLVQRILVDRQWAEGTTLEDYVEDLHKTVRSPSSQLAMYDLGRGAVAAVFGLNSAPSTRLGVKLQPYTVVVYAANRSAIISGYQASSLSTLNIPGDVRWYT